MIYKLAYMLGVKYANYAHNYGFFRDSENVAVNSKPKDPLSYASKNEDVLESVKNDNALGPSVMKAADYSLLPIGDGAAVADHGPATARPAVTIPQSPTIGKSEKEDKGSVEPTYKVGRMMVPQIELEARKRRKQMVLDNQDRPRTFNALSVQEIGDFLNQGNAGIHLDLDPDVGG